MIQFEGVSKVYDNQLALKEITLTIEKGELAFVTGPSGAGKTTLLKLIYAHERPDKGRLTVGEFDLSTIPERDIPRLRRQIGIVFQDFRLIDSKTVFENVAMPLRIRGMSDRDLRDIVYESLRLVGLRHKIDSYPPTLSGGEQQRVAIARAIVAEPLILLADEPTGNLDPENTKSIMNIFKEINARGTTVVIATHNPDLYTHSGRRVFKLKEGYLTGVEIL